MRLATLALSLVVPMFAGGQSTRGPGLLDTMRTRVRPVLLFAGPNDPRVQTQYAELAARFKELHDRQMQIVLITQSPTRDGTPTPVGTVAATQPEAEALRKHFHIERNTFTLLLLGKDGGEKFRSTRPVPFERLRALVDAMPMRQQEMNTR